ncbi:MAG: hypothetical protein O7D36_09850 [Gammaproteobacteria bacterium]|jgi:hypothetical protein|nr:hypothetical protein [Gammaproteobacteria bacterium]
MRSGTIIIALALALIAPSIGASTLAIPGHHEFGETQTMPRRGISMDSVLVEFGEPEQRRGPVGEPPISEWVYGSFRVYFEDQTVLHSIDLNTLIMPR